MPTLPPQFPLTTLAEYETIPEDIRAEVNDNAPNLPLECYDFMLSKKKKEQEQLLRILIEVDKYKNN